MSSSINLLVKTDDSLLKQKKWIKILKIISFFSVIALLSSSILLFILNQRQSKASINKEINSTLYSISFMHKKEEKIIYINNKLQSISKILAKRSNYTDKIDKLIDKMSSDIVVEKLSVDRNSILLTISVSSLSSINDFINNLLVLAEKKEINILTLDSLSLNEEKSNYSVSLRAAL